MGFIQLGSGYGFLNKNPIRILNIITKQTHHKWDDRKRQNGMVKTGIELKALMSKRSDQNHRSNKKNLLIKTSRLHFYFLLYIFFSF
jgi:hypothetical protein